MFRLHPGRDSAALEAKYKQQLGSAFEANRANLHVLLSSLHTYWLNVFNNDLLDDNELITRSRMMIGIEICAIAGEAHKSVQSSFATAMGIVDYSGDNILVGAVAFRNWLCIESHAALVKEVMRNEGYAFAVLKDSREGTCDADLMKAITSSLHDNTVVDTILHAAETWKEFTKFVRDRGSDYYLATEDIPLVAHISNRQIQLHCPHAYVAVPSITYKPSLCIDRLMRNRDQTVFVVPVGTFPTGSSTLQVVHNGRLHFEQRRSRRVFYTATIRSPQSAGGRLVVGYSSLPISFLIDRVPTVTAHRSGTRRRVESSEPEMRFFNRANISPRFEI
jgi:hypothetical protein